MREKPERMIKSNPAIAESIVTDQLGEDVSAWLRGQASTHHLKWLLAHAYDGVIWGRLDNGRLITSHDAAQGNRHAEAVCPPLRLATLQQVRVFSCHTELLLWRDGENSWQARLIRNANDGEDAVWTDAIDEPQMLWGTDTVDLANGFTLMVDGSQGLRHAVPLNVSGTFTEENRPLRLWVRHYLQEDNDGFSRIAASRLLRLETEETE